MSQATSVDSRDIHIQDEMADLTNHPIHGTKNTSRRLIPTNLVFSPPPPFTPYPSGSDQEASQDTGANASEFSLYPNARLYPRQARQLGFVDLSEWMSGTALTSATLRVKSSNPIEESFLYGHPKISCHSYPAFDPVSNHKHQCILSPPRIYQYPRSWVIIDRPCFLHSHSSQNDTQQCEVKGTMLCGTNDGGYWIVKPNDGPEGYNLLRVSGNGEEKVAKESDLEFEGLFLPQSMAGRQKRSKSRPSTPRHSKKQKANESNTDDSQHREDNMILSPGSSDPSTLTRLVLGPEMAMSPILYAQDDPKDLTTNSESSGNPKRSPITAITAHNIPLPATAVPIVGPDMTMSPILDTPKGTTMNTDPFAHGTRSPATTLHGMEPGMAISLVMDDPKSFTVDTGPFTHGTPSTAIALPTGDPYTKHEEYHESIHHIVDNWHQQIRNDLNFHIDQSLLLRNELVKEQTEKENLKNRLSIVEGKLAISETMLTKEKKDGDHARLQLTAAKAKLATTIAESENHRREHAQLKDELKTLEAATSAVKADFVRSQEEVTTLNREIHDLNTQLDAWEQYRRHQPPPRR